MRAKKMTVSVRKSGKLFCCFQVKPTMLLSIFGNIYKECICYSKTIRRQPKAKNKFFYFQIFEGCSLVRFFIPNFMLSVVTFGCNCLKSLHQTDGMNLLKKYLNSFILKFLFVFYVELTILCGK